MPNQPTKEDQILETLSGLVVAVGTRFDKIDNKLVEHDSRFADVDQQLREARVQLDRIEHSILEEHARRIEPLEQRVGLAK